ncbi:MAG: transposase [Tetragenococcus koreensis]|nr:transposase [Tetragenococcus koreensis]
MNPTDIYQVKRDFFQFSQKLAQGLAKPDQKFIFDMIFGMVKSQSPLLSDIARALEEDTRLLYTVKRLSRRGADFDDFHPLHQNYLQTIQPHLQEDMLVIVDNSDITKPFGEQFEALARVHDGSRDGIEKGYISANIAIASPRTKHPIPIYSHLFSAAEEYFDSTNVETYKGLNLVKHLFQEKPYTLVMDRGYDSNDMFTFMHKQDASFIVRLQDKRYLKYQNKRIKVPELALRRKGKITFSSTIKGKKYALKVSHTPVELPCLPKVPLNMVVVYGYGQKPMKLLTNHPIKNKEDVLAIVKAYITRWRIEENFRVQKQEYHLEKVRTLHLNSLRLIHCFVSYLIGHHSLLLEKETCYVKQVLHRAKATFSDQKIRLKLYRFIRGLAEILRFDSTGIQAYKRVEKRPRAHQLALAV